MEWHSRMGSRRRGGGDAGRFVTGRQSRALVTGANGFIGRRLVAHLAERGRDVVAVDRVPCTGVPGPSIVLDVRTPGALAGLLDGETTVFHLAAWADIRRSLEDPRGDFDSNVRGLFEVIESARHAGARVVFASTASVFDTGNVLPWAERAYRRPASPYAAGKLAGEAYCQAFHRSYGVDVRIARMFNVYGIGMTRFVIHDLVRKIQVNPKTLEILGTGTQVRDFLYVDDAVRGLVTIDQHGEAGEDYNLGSGIPVRIIDLARAIGALMGHPSIAIVPTGRSFPGDTPCWYADISKIRRLGFAPEVPLDLGLRRTVDWLIDGAAPRTDA
jgi:UDP-glucose 4-epimerase